MNKKTLFLLFTILILIAGGLWLRLSFKPKPLPPKLTLQKMSFSQLPDWQTANVKKSLNAFKRSCRLFLKLPAERDVGSSFIPLKAKDWYPACQALFKLKVKDSQGIRAYFEKWFTPVIFFKGDVPLEGLFTGYYQPLLNGSLEKADAYPVPLYGLPKNLLTIDLSDFGLRKQVLIARVEGDKVVPFYERAQINKGAIHPHAKVIAWVENKIDRLFLEIQGSGVIQLTDGKKMYVGYEGQNGAPYTALAQVLIDRGVMTKDSASMQRIRDYLSKHPKLMDKLLNKNKSFVFLRKLNQDVAIGAQNLPLTGGVSLAIDRQYIPLGTPIWLNTSYPDLKENVNQPFKRLMIAQDTGGAIKGPVRGDVFWGEGTRAAQIAGRMKNKGRYWLLLPKTTITKNEEENG